MNHLWQSTLFVFGVWLAALALRGNAARVRCWLWTAASIKFLVPLSVLVSLGGWFQWRDAPAVLRPLQPSVLFVMEDVLAPVDVIDLVDMVNTVDMVGVAPTSTLQSFVVLPLLPWLLSLLLARPI